MATVIDSYSFANQDGNSSVNSTNWLAQSFTGNGGTLGSCEFALWKTAGATGNLNILIRAHSGTFGTNSVPTGANLATSDSLDISTLTTSSANYTINFSGTNQITLTNGTKYTVILSGSGISGAMRVGTDESSPTHGGNFANSANSGSTWSANSTIDICFTLYEISAATKWKLPLLGIG